MYNSYKKKPLSYHLLNIFITYMVHCIIYKNYYQRDNHFILQCNMYIAHNQGDAALVEYMYGTTDHQT